MKFFISFVDSFHYFKFSNFFSYHITDFKPSTNTIIAIILYYYFVIIFVTVSINFYLFFDHIQPFIIVSA